MIEIERDEERDSFKREWDAGSNAQQSSNDEDEDELRAQHADKSFFGRPATFQYASYLFQPSVMTSQPSDTIQPIGAGNDGG